VLGLQLLPVKQIVSWLTSAQMTEEIVHANDSGKKIQGWTRSTNIYRPSQIQLLLILIFLLPVQFIMMQKL